jgi:hypothetical protein
MQVDEENVEIKEEESISSKTAKTVLRKTSRSNSKLTTQDSLASLNTGLVGIKAKKSSKNTTEVR